MAVGGVAVVVALAVVEGGAIKWYIQKIYV